MHRKFLVAITLLLALPALSRAAIDVNIDAALREATNAEFVDTPPSEALSVLTWASRISEGSVTGPAMGAGRVTVVGVDATGGVALPFPV